MTETELAALPYKNRRGGLIFFGLVELVIGALCLLFVPLTLMSLLFAPGRAGAPALPASQIFVSVSLYLVSGALLVTLGVGSMLSRRWARDLSLIVAWVWLIFGVAATVGLILVLPLMMPTMPSSPPGTATFVLTCTAIFSGLFGILIPLAMVLFYRSPHVRATCLAADPHPRWTERAPLPLLGLSLYQALSALGIASMSAYAVLPLGSQIVTGPIAVITYCAIGIVLLYVSWGLFHSSPAAWWTGIIYGVLVAAYCVVVFPNIDYDAMVRAMRIPTTPSMPNLAAIYRNPWFVGYLGVFWLAYFGYFLFVRRYFPRDAQASPGSTT